MKGHCAICHREAERPHGRQGELLCGHCYGRTVTVRTAAVERLGARTFYVSSLTVPPVDYTVKRFHQRMTCTCPDFTHRAQVLGVNCKHVNLVAWLARAVGGYRAIGLGASYTFRLAEGGTTCRRRIPTSVSGAK